MKYLPSLLRRFIYAVFTSFGLLLCLFGSPFVARADFTTPFPISNVLFIPGTLTSRLYMKNPDGSERDLWEPRSDLDIPLLAMNSDGTSKQAIYTRDIMDQLYSNDPLYHGALHLALKKDSDVYGSFESFMDSLVAKHTIKEWRTYPYDWRYDVRDIVADGTLIGTATTSPTRVYLQDVVQQLASTSPTGKVIIVAHSNGGLIAKALAIDLEKKGEGELLDRIIFVGTPQFGTPKSITDLLHGDEFTQLGGLLMYSDTVRDTEATMPGAYDLIPSPAYFSHIENPVVTFDTAKPAVQFHDAIGSAIHSFSQLSDFLSDAFNLDSTAGLIGSTKTPIPLSLALITKAEATHDALDTWVPSDDLSLAAVVGWGNLTPYQETYTGTSGLNCDRTSFFIPVACSLLPQIQPGELFSSDGDDTVVLKSAIGDVDNTYYLDAQDLAARTGIKTGHSSLLASPPVQEIVRELITRAPISSSSDLTQEKPTGGFNPLLVISAHSPVNILATDDAGNETGIVPVPELPGIYFQKEDIPGSSIDVIGDEKYLYLPQGIPLQVSMQGYDVGTTTIDIGEMDSNGSTTITHVFPDISTTPNTTGIFNLIANGSVASASPEFVDAVASTTDSSSAPGTARIISPEATTTQTSMATSTDADAVATGTIPIYVSTAATKKSIEKLPGAPSGITTSVIQFVEHTLQPITNIPELIRAFITIESNKKSWSMYSTIFISFIRGA